VPFVLAALAFDWMTARLAWIKRHYRAVQVTAGMLLVVFGVLMMLGVLETNRDQVLARLKDFQAALDQLEQALEHDDLPALQNLLDSAQSRYQTLL